MPFCPVRLNFLGLIILVALVVCTGANAASRGPNMPTAVTQSQGGMGGLPSTAQWVNPENASASDDVRSSLAFIDNEASYELEASDFGFSIPDDAIVMGVEVHIERQGTVTSGNPYAMFSCGSIISDGEAGGVWPASDEVLTLGSADNAIGQLTPADVNSSFFNVKVWVCTDSSYFSYSGSGTYEVDSVSATVYYIPSGVCDQAVSSATASVTQSQSSEIAVTMFGVPSTAQWANPANALVSDDARASLAFVNGEYSYELRVSDLGLSVPDDAIVTGVEVHVERQGTVASGNPYAAVRCGSIVSGGEAGGDWPASDEVLTLGSPSNAIGELTPADVNASSFGVRIWVNTDSAYSSYSGTGMYEVDNVSVTVTYVPSGVCEQAVATAPASATQSQGGMGGLPSTAQWASPGNAAASDDARASMAFVNGECSYELRVSDLGLSVPDDAIITGVEVHIERQGTVTSGNPYTMISCGSIVSGGEAGGDWPVADEVLTLGGPSNAIGELTPAYVNSSSFGVKIWVNTDSSWFSYSGTGTYEVDNVSVTVFYIPAEAIDELPAASPWALAVLAGALSLAALTLHARRRIRS